MSDGGSRGNTADPAVLPTVTVFGLAGEPPQSCASCRFFGPHVWEGAPLTDGKCRRHAPATLTGSYTYEWPLVLADDWCGEYEARLGRVP